MSEVKRRRKATLSAKPDEDQHNKQSSLESKKNVWMDPRTASSLLSLVACVGLTWFLFQQSVQLAALEKKYRLLKQDAVKSQDREDKINIMSEKFESSLGILWEASSSISMMTKFEQEVSSLRNIIYDIKNSEQAHSEKIESINAKFQTIIDSWKKSQAEVDTNTSILKSEAKHLHGEVTSQINAADSRLKSLSERLKDLQDSTLRNLKTLNRQEEEELTKVEQQLQYDTEATGKLEEQQNNLLARNSDLSQKILAYGPKLEECKTYLPVIEKAIRSVVKVSSELIAAEKKMEDMAIKVFNAEDEMMKAASDIMDIQNTLKDMQYKSSILKLQDDIFDLKEKIIDIAESETEITEENHHSDNV
ncbi:inhibitor of nuclear factor kappa-B kinase-interacting protein isoform X2 [Varanus komodoensis]|uniref:IKBKB interacting protein n=1 Tax=Varanus komodoensis TaxID=61221 RepID=A0A8D2Q4Z2_VARKO|nr:inhibitor of nuclear factor kappa-B kinase-interacting protein isoform X2 [Varanus komodoensis]